jgi:hypothetical protein
MEKKGSNEDRLKNLLEEGKIIEEMHSGIDIQSYLGSADNMPEVQHLEQHDYDNDIQSSIDTSKEIISSLAEEYLKDNDEFRNGAYIKNKINEDIGDYAQTLLLQKIMNRNIIQASRLIDAGEMNSDLFKAISVAAKEIRELSKDRQKQRREIENYYKEIRKDFGLKDLNETTDISSDEDEDGASIPLNNIKLNDVIDSILDIKKNERSISEDEFEEIKNNALKTKDNESDDTDDLEFPS